MSVVKINAIEVPDGAGPDYVRGLYDAFSTLSFLPFPFDSQVVDGIFPEWHTVQPDSDYHVRLSALPYPGSETDLGKLVARLHANPLDMRRPLWEAHFIEGLSGGRFAMYFKAHHCAVDGMAPCTMRQLPSISAPSRPSRAGPIQSRNAARIPSRLSPVMATVGGASP